MTNIIEHKHIEEVLPYIESLKDHQDTLVLFDLDDVLVNPKGQLGSFRWWEKRLNELQQSGVPLEKALAQLDNFFVKVQPHLSYALIEPSTQSIFERIQKTGVTIMGLTGRPEGSDLLTHKQLGDLGVRFESASSIVYCNGGCKGKYLQEALTRSSFKPKRIIFIDDVLKNITAVQEMLQKTYPDIDFLGVHYTHVNSFTTFDAAQAERELQGMQQKLGEQITV